LDKQYLIATKKLDTNDDKKEIKKNKKEEEIQFKEMWIGDDEPAQGVKSWGTLYGKVHKNL